MPLRWQRGTNPYVHNYFGRLRIGPNTKPRLIVEHAKRQRQKLATGEKLELAGQEVDEHAVGEASERLRESGSLAEELLLVHPQSDQKGKQWKEMANQLQEAARLSEDREPLALAHPSGILWFTPAPGVEAADLPEWEALGLVGPGDPEDLALDIVFDC